MKDKDLKKLLQLILAILFVMFIIYTAMFVAALNAIQ
jgi:hypothetical protein